MAFLGDNIHQSTEAHNFESLISLQPVNNLKFWRSLPAAAMCPFLPKTYGSVCPATPVNSEQENHSHVAVGDTILLRDCAKGVFRSQKSKGRICYMHTHTLTSITSIKRVPLTSEINITPRDHSAGDCCYKLLPVCREGNWGMHVRDQTLSPSRSERGFPSTRSPPAHIPETQHESNSEILPEQRAQDVCSQGMI